MKSNYCLIALVISFMASVFSLTLFLVGFVPLSVFISLACITFVHLLLFLLVRQLIWYHLFPPTLFLWRNYVLNSKEREFAQTNLRVISELLDIVCRLKQTDNAIIFMRDLAKSAKRVRTMLQYIIPYMDTSLPDYTADETDRRFEEYLALMKKILISVDERVLSLTDVAELGPENEDLMLSHVSLPDGTSE